MKGRDPLRESHIRELAQQVGYSYLPGLSIEIRDFLERHQNVVEHRLTITDDGQYRIWVRLRRHGEDEARDVFHELVTFVEFADATFYVRTFEEQRIRYLLLSVSHGPAELSFFCEVTFSA